MTVTDDKNEKQVVSKQRVADHGEVYTAKREVNAMLDLVKEETERIDSRFLEPACGNGNFLVEILNRKMEAVRKRLHLTNDPSLELEQCIRFLLKKNILCGDALTMLQQDGEPITFCEWTFIGNGGKVKRRDFELAELLRNVEYDKPKAGEEGLLFADTGEPTFVHLPKREYPLTDYLKLPDYE